MSNVFNIENVLMEKNEKSIESFVSKEPEFFNTALDFVEDLNKEYNNGVKKLYESILESNGNDEIIAEGFSKLFSNIQKLIDKFITFIKNMIARFIATINKMINNDKYLTGNINDIIKDFKEEDEFYYDAYEYTINSNIPVVDALASFSKDFMDIDFSTLKDYDNSREKADKIISLLDEKYNNLIYEFQTGWFDSFRGRVIEAKEPIPADKFNEELFKIYRADRPMDKVLVDKKYANACYIRFNNYKSAERFCKEKQASIIKEYQDIKTKIDNMIKRHYDKDLSKISIDLFGPGDITMTNVSMAKEVINKLDAFMKLKSRQVVEMMTIHSLAFSAKLDAIVACYKQDREVLYKTISRVRNNIKLPKELLYDATNESYNCNYELFLINTESDKKDLDCFIKESLLIANNESTEVLNEITWQSVKERIGKIIEVIKTMWNKFITKIVEIFATDKEYLDKYKEIILNRKPKPAKLVMPKYSEGIKNILVTDVPLFNYQNKELVEKLVDQVTFGTYITTGKRYQAYDGKEEFSTYCKNIFRGSSNDIEVASESLNMTDIFNYCYNYKNMVTKIQKDSTTIQSSGKNAENWIRSITPAPTTATPESATIVNEVEIKKGAEAKPGATTNADENIPAKQMNNISKDSKEGNETDTKTAVGNDSENISEANAKVKVYLSICTKLFSAKLTAAEEIYKGYMQIIRSHVKDYVATSKGKKNTEGKKEADEPTNYSKLSDSEKELVDDVFGSNAKNLSKEEAQNIANKAKEGANSTMKDRIAKAFSYLFGKE